MDIGEWYDMRDKERREAYKALEDARSRGASAKEIKKLEAAYERAAYVGD